MVFWLTASTLPLLLSLHAYDFQSARTGYLGLLHKARPPQPYPNAIDDHEKDLTRFPEPERQNILIPSLPKADEYPFGSTPNSQLEYYPIQED